MTPKPKRIAPAKAGHNRPKIDRLDVRRAVGEAQARIAAARRAHFNDPKRQAERDALHKRWRDLLQQASDAQRALEAFIKRDMARDVSPTDQKLIADAKRKHPDLQTYAYDPDGSVKVCAATGLALFDDDETYGDGESGVSILRQAIDVAVEPVPGFDATGGP